MKAIFNAVAASLFVLALGCQSNEADAISDMEAPYLGNATCPMSGEPVDQASYIETAGQRVYFCCDKCVEMAKKDPADALQSAYATTSMVGNANCPISGQPVGDASATYQGHEVGLCCNDCAAEFAKKPAVYTGKAVAANH